MRAWTSSASSDPPRVSASAVSSGQTVTARGAAQRLAGHRAAKPVVFVVALLPLAWLIWAVAADALGANPAEALIRATGDWTLRLLCLTLAVTPLRHWSGLHAIARWRRMLGLFTFVYACVHFLSYAWLDMGLAIDDIVVDVAKRPFILVGTLCLLILTALAATSFDRAVKALGARRWQALHRSVYAVALLALLHFFWMRSGKNDFAEVAIYAVVIAALLGWRLVRRVWRAG
jgi:sulfoxide reductase heme-binding subunit YedZ